MGYAAGNGYADEPAHQGTSRGRRRRGSSPDQQPVPGQPVPGQPVPGEEYGEPQRGAWGEREPDSAYYDEPPNRHRGRNPDAEPLGRDDATRPHRRGKRGSDEADAFDTRHQSGYDTGYANAYGAAQPQAYPQHPHPDPQYPQSGMPAQAQQPQWQEPHAMPGDAGNAGGRGSEPPDDERPGRRRGGGGRKRTLSVTGWISIVLTSVLVIGTLTAYKIYRDTFGLIKRGSSTDELDKNRPVNQTGALNVLLVGSDTRTGDNKKYGQHMENEGERTDTIMMLHVSPNRDKATLLSFPRDSMVLIPNCKQVKTGVVIAQHLGMINSAFSEGGMVCTRRTIETLTQIPIDHWVKVDFTGFKNIVNALGGIEICLPQDVNDKKSKLTLGKGKQLVRGEQALAYVRLRYGLGDGSDTSRIKRQQVFLSQVVKKATSSTLLTDVSKLQGFITATAQSVTMDDNLDTEALIQIAQSASKLTATGFKATTVPWEAYVADKNRVQWKQPDASNLFAGIRGDVDVIPTATPSAATAGTKSATPTVTKPSQVKVQVFNGTNTGGRAKEVAEALTAQGFKVVGIGDARKADGTDQPKTLVQYTGQSWDYAKILQGNLLNAVSPTTGKVSGGPVTPFVSLSAPATGSGRVAGPVIQLVVGADWKGVKIPLTVGDNAVTSKTNICTS